MLTYDPGTFASLYASEIGQRLWTFLTLPENVDRLRTASELSRPAVEGIGEQLLEEFGEDVLDKEVKRMIGDMVRQLLEQRGWVLDQSDVTVRLVPFINATRYRRPDWFTFHVFRNESDKSDIAITEDSEKFPLPGWKYYTTFDSPLKAAVAFDIQDISELRQQVQAEGYYRTRLPAAE